MVTDLETHPLPQGGGPPDPRARRKAFSSRGCGQPAVSNMVGTMPWTRGAIAVLRDSFDAFEFCRCLMTMPTSRRSLTGCQRARTPLESYGYREMVAAHESQMAAVHASQPSSGELDRLDNIRRHHARTHTGSGETRHPIRVLGTFHPSTDRFAWAMDEPPFDRCSAAHVPSHDARHGDGALAGDTARLGGTWLFLEKFGDDDIVLGAVSS